MYCLFCRVPVFPVVAAALRLSCAQQKRRWLCGLGTLWWTTVPFAEITSWTFVSSARRIKARTRLRNALLPGVCAITRFTSTASLDG